VFFVATVDGYVIGWSHLDLPHSDKLRETARLTVGVRKEYRGYGVGKRLLDRALSWAETNGYRKVYNSVARTNMNAVTFLERQGWHREAVRENHFTIDGEPVDEVMLAYTF
jgi:ribosomal protein S18 acetylase RimI-like enzyme